MTNYGKLVITCGGTGGHFYPGLATAREHQRQGGEVLLLLSGVNSARQREIAESQGIPARELAPMPSPGRSPVRWFRFLSGLVRGFRQARSAIRDFGPAAALGMGSFASLPVLFAARSRGVPVYLHDGNARIGRANRYLSRVARFMGTAFPADNAATVACPVDCTGMPLRRELIDACELSRSEAIEQLNQKYRVRFHPEARTLLIFGGSQGAASLNQSFSEAVRKLGNDAPLQVIHLAGPKNYEALRAAYGATSLPLLLLPSCDTMELAYAAADLVVARSGGSTLAELLLFGKGALLIPYPFAAEDHQWANARYAVHAGAAIAIDDSECTPRRAVELITAFLDSPDQWENRGRRARDLARPEAARELLDRIFG